MRPNSNSHSGFGKRWLLAVLVVSAAVAPSLGQMRRVEKGSLEVVADRTAYEAGTEARLAVVMAIESGWHTNSHKPTYDYLIGTDVRVELPEGWPEAEIVYPDGEMKKFGFAEDLLSVYEDEVVMIGRFTVPADATEGNWPVEVSLTYQACDDRSCLAPVTTARTIQLAVGAGGQPTLPELFVAAAGGPPTGTRPANLALVLLLGVVGGLILNAMPCVLPVLSLKIFGLVKSASLGRSQVVVGSLATAAGILLSFWALALAAIAARSAGSAVGWGVQFQNPLFVTFLAVVVILFCLNLWGLFEIRLPAGLVRLADSGPKQGIPGHLVSGLFATLMATPCSAPFLGTAVGFALSQEAPIILAVFTAIAVGMSLPYLLLAAVPGFAQMLPKPGPWMENLRMFMGFLLSGAAVWLFYVLAAQVTPERLAFIELSILGLALFVWMGHQATGKRGLRAVATLGVVLTIATSLGLAAGAQGEAGGASVEAANHLIPWLPFDRQEAERLAAEGELVFVDVTADWCFTCKVNERLVLETPEVAATFKQLGVIPMKADWTNRNDDIASFMADFDRYGIPFYLLYRPGKEPHLFGELLTKEGLIETVEAAVQMAEAGPPQ
jgi:suppressor for copper-sensitivity B